MKKKTIKAPYGALMVFIEGGSTKNLFRLCVTILGGFRGILFQILGLLNHHPKDAHLCTIQNWHFESCSALRPRRCLW